MLRAGLFLTLASLSTVPAFCAASSTSSAKPAFASSSATGAPAFAAAVSGNVADATGALIPGAQVQLSDAQGKVVKSVTSDAGGDFSLSSVSPGDYTLTCFAERIPDHDAGDSRWREWHSRAVADQAGGCAIGD